jgi:hypothetical protein
MIDVQNNKALALLVPSLRSILFLYQLAPVHVRLEKLAGTILGFFTYVLLLDDDDDDEDDDDDDVKGRTV